MKEKDYHAWVALQQYMQELQRAPGWEAYRAAIADRRNEALEDLLKGGSDQHDFYVGFLAGLDWLAQYPEVLDTHVRTLRSQQ